LKVTFISYPSVWAEADKTTKRKKTVKNRFISMNSW
jgi:hypothetical protein